MRIAVIGAGFTGLTAAYELAKAGKKVVVFEKDPFAGGLASGIRQAVPDYPSEWWDLERFYHHWFADQKDLLRLIGELDLAKKIIAKETVTSIWFAGKIYPFDSPANYLAFPHLDAFDKIRGLSVVGFLRLLPAHKTFWQFLEKQTADSFLSTWMGEKAIKLPWRGLLVGKFGQFYPKVNLAWFWSRIKERTKKLLYLEGGFATLIDALAAAIVSGGGEMRLGRAVSLLTLDDRGRWELKAADSTEEIFDRVIVTVPPQIFVKLIPQLPNDYQVRILKNLQGLGAQNFILVLKRQLMEKTYWLNLNERSFPFLIAAEHTNFIESSHYGGRHILYLGEYLDPQDPKMQLGPNELLKLYLPGLKRINPNFSSDWIKRWWFFREDFAQPIFPVNHSLNIPSFTTPLPHLYLASMSQVYPWDRGTNYAVRIGQQVSRLAQS